MPERIGLDAAIGVVASGSDGMRAMHDSLIRITDIAHETVPGVDFASITVRHQSGRLETVAPSSPLLYVADGLQYELNEGPCYDAVTDIGIVYCADLAHDSRWPMFGPKARTLGLCSLLAVRLVHPGKSFMALNLYSDAVGAFADHHDVARIFLAQDPPAYDARRQGEQLKTELSSRTMVEHATGILMHRHGVDADQALALLNQLAQQRHGTGTGNTSN